MPQENGKKKELLKRGEVKTMVKDLAKLREQEARREKERIMGLSPAVLTPPAPPATIPPSSPPPHPSIPAATLPPSTVKPKVLDSTPDKAPEEKEEIEKIAQEIEERRMRSLEEKEEERKKSVLEKEGKRQRFEREKIEIDEEIEALSLRKPALQEKRTQLLEKIEEIKNNLEPIRKEEVIIEENKKQIEEKEKRADSPEKKEESEKQRWKIEEQRREVESKKWEIEEQIEIIEGEIKEIDLERQKISEKEKNLEKEKTQIFQKEKAIGLEEEKTQLGNQLSQLSPKRQPLGVERNNLLAKKEQIEIELKKTLSEEKDTEQVLETIEEKEETTTDAKEKREIEKQRWKIEQDRESLEKRKWEIEKEKKELNTQLATVDSQYQEVLRQENTLKREIKEIEAQLDKIPRIVSSSVLPKSPPPPPDPAPLPPSPPPPLEPPSPQSAVSTRPSSPTPSPPPPASPSATPLPPIPDNTIEDKAGIEKGPTKTIRIKERMKEMQTKEEETRKRFLERIEGGEGESPTVKTPLPITPKNEIEQPSSPPDILRPLPIKPSLKEKIWVRILIGAIIFTFLSIGLTFAYWFLAIREPSSPPQTPEPPSIEKPTIIIPSSLLSTETTETLEIEAPGEIPEALVQLLKKDFGEEKLTRVLIKNPKENKIIGLKEFFEAFQVKTPEGFYEKLNNDFTLFIYSLDGKNNLGFVAKIEQKQNLANFLKIWEETIEEDTENLFSTLGKEKPALAPYFKQTAYKNITIRYQTFSKDDFGICYSLFDDYLIFTTSFESIKKASESVEDSGLENKIGQLFLIGFEGKTLTPQLEKTLKDLRPGGVVLLSRNIESKEQLKILIKQLQNLSLENTGLPLFIAVDQEGGRICRLEFAQEKTAQSAIENTGQAYQVGFSRGEELKELGVNLNLAPVLDMAESEDFLFERSFQKGADETGELGKALITGQKQAGVLTAAKHFPGYGGISFNPERSELPILSKIPEISQFKKAIEAKPEMIMASNVIYTTLNKSLPLSFSLEGIQFLKRELGNDYLIISDDLSSPVLKEEFSLEKSITLVSNAGIDILLVAGFDDPKDPTSAIEALREAVKDNEVSQKRIEESSLKIIKLKGNLL